MKELDINDPVQRNGAVYFVVGRGTEGGAHPFQLSVVANQWGTVSSVIDNSGYSIGTIQVDLGQRGDWPLGAVEGRALRAGEESYIDAIVNQASAYAAQNSLPFPQNEAGLEQLRADLHTHGNGLNGRSSITFIDASDRATFNAWAGSDDGRSWIHRNIDYPQVTALADAAHSTLEQYGQQISPERRFEVFSILAKSANQLPSAYRALVSDLKGGADGGAFMATANEISERYRFYRGLEAGEKAVQYQENFQKPGNAVQMEEAHRLVAQPGYQPANEAQMPSVQVALNAYRRDLNDPSVLDRGDLGEEVRVLQRALIDNGQTLTDDGTFGPGTEKALTAYQRTSGLESTGFGDRPTMRALGIAPVLDERSSASLHRMIEALNNHPRFTETQVGRIANSAQQFMLENRQTLGEVSQIRVSTNGQTLLFLNDYAQMRTMAMDHAIRGHVPAQPLITQPAAEPARETPLTEGPIR